MTDTHAFEAQRSKTIEEWFGLFGALGVFAAILLLGYQALLWLKEDQWIPISISSILAKLNIDYYSIVDIRWVGVKE